MTDNKKVNFYKHLKQEVNQYFIKQNTHKKANFNMYFKCLFMLSLYIIPYCLMILGVVNDPSYYWICWLLMGLGMSGVGMCIMHDGNHNAFSTKKSVNDLMGLTLQVVGGSYKNWRIQHNQLHHKYTNMINHDPDVSPVKLLRFSPDSPYRKFYRFQFIYAWFLYGLMTFSFATMKEFKQLFEWRDSTVISGIEFKQLMKELILWKMVYYFFILFIPLFFLDINFLQWFGLFMLMHFVSGFLLAIVFQTAHIMPDCKHLSYDKEFNPNEWAINQLETTSNYSPNSKIFSWFIGGLNYQVEHHLFPGICHVHYAGISKIVRKLTKEYGLPYHCEKNFFQAILSHGKMLYVLGRP